MTHRVPAPGSFKPRLVLLALVAAALGAGLLWGLGGALAADPSASASADKITLRVAWTNDPDNLNPFIGAETSSYEIWMLNYDFLVGYTLDLQPTPDLATSWETSADGKVWTFHLREGVTWQDGEAFTARDVAFTYNYIIDNQMGAYSSLTTFIDKVVAVDDPPSSSVAASPRPTSCAPGSRSCPSTSGPRSSRPSPAPATATSRRSSARVRSRRPRSRRATT